MVCCILITNNILIIIFCFFGDFMKKKRRVKKNRSIILRLLILIVCAYFTVTLANLWSEVDSKIKEKKAYEQQYETMLNEVEELRSLLDSDDKKIIEKAARERFGYAYPNEQIFKDTSGN